MQHWLSSGRLIDLVLGLMVLEALALGAWRRRTGSGIAPLDLLVNLAAGVALMLAVRTALTGATGWVPVWLCAALAAHLADLACRWRRHPER